MLLDLGAHFSLGHFFTVGFLGQCEELIEAVRGPLVLDDLGEARASAAIALAESLDAAVAGETGAIMQAIPAMSKGLREALTEIAESVGGDDPLLASLNDAED